jgi:hypothetical protein
LGRSELVAAAADADPVTRLVLGWLAAKRSENTQAADAQDIAISPAGADQAPGDLVAAYLAGPASGRRGRLGRGH